MEVSQTLPTFFPAIRYCAGLEDTEVWFKGVIFNPTSSTLKIVEIPPHLAHGFLP